MDGARSRASFLRPPAEQPVEGHRLRGADRLLETGGQLLGDGLLEARGGLAGGCAERDRERPVALRREHGRKVTFVERLEHVGL